MGKCGVCAGLLTISVAVLIGTYFPQPFAWTWFIYGLDYLLGNPSSLLGAYRDQLMEEAYQQWPVPRDGYLEPQPFLEMDGKTFTHEAFVELTDGYTKPVIIRGMFADAPATTKWTPEYLSEHFGDRQFVSFVNSSVGSGDSAQGNVYSATVRTVVDNITKGGKNYIFNANLDYSLDKDMAEELDIARLGWDQEPQLVQFFIGLSRPGEIPTGSPLHSSIAPNLNFQLSGQKKWVMIDPKYLIYTKPLLLDTQFALLHGSDFRPIGQRWLNMPRLEGLVNKGDAIYIPPYWYHEVRNQPVDDWQISIALRYWSTSASVRNQPWLSMIHDLGVRGRPCLRGTRVFFCAPLQAKMGGWTGTSLQTKSEAATEGASLTQKVMKPKSYEQSYE